MKSKPDHTGRTVAADKKEKATENHAGTNILKWRNFLFLTVIAGIYTSFLFPDADYNTFNKDDSSSFLILGVNFSQSGVFSADVPGSHLREHATWPPGFPLLLGSLISCFGISWTALKMCMVTFGLANLVALAFLLRRHQFSTAAIVLTALSPTYFLFSHVLMTEVPFMLMSSLTLILIGEAKSRKAIAIAGIMASLSFFVRGYAVAFLPTGFLFLITQTDNSYKERIIRIAIFCGLLTVAVISWKQYSTSVIERGDVDAVTTMWGNGADFSAWRNMDPPGNIVTKNLRKLYWWVARIPVFYTLAVLDWETYIENDVWLIPSLSLIGIAALGWLSALKYQRSVVEWWTLFFLLLLVALPGKSNPRYWIVLLPFYYRYLLMGLNVLVNQFPRSITHLDIPRQKTLKLVEIALIIATSSGLILHLNSPSHLRFESDVFEELSLAGRYIQSSKQKTSDIFSKSGHLVYSATLRQCKPPPESISTLDFDQHFFLFVPNPAYDGEEPWDNANAFYSACSNLVRQQRLKVGWRGRSILVLEPFLSE